MTDLAKPTDAEDITKLLIHYGFDLDGCSPEQLIQHWFAYYPSDWVRLAVIEALYQGRYKVISVEQILAIWQRRQKPIPHFNGEFQRIVSSRLPKSLREKHSSKAIDAHGLSHVDELTAPERWRRRVEVAKSAMHPASAEIAAVKDTFARMPPSLQSIPKSSHVNTSESVDDSKHSDAVNDVLACDEALSPLNGTHRDFVVVIDAREESAIAPDSSYLEEPMSSIPPQTSTYPGLAAKPESSTLSNSNGSGHHKPAHCNSELKRVEWSVHYPVKTPSISQFVPTGRASGFYSRLKSVVQRHVFVPPSEGGSSATSPALDDSDGELNWDSSRPETMPEAALEPGWDSASTHSDFNP